MTAPLSLAEPCSRCNRMHRRAQAAERATRVARGESTHEMVRWKRVVAGMMRWRRWHWGLCNDIKGESEQLGARVTELEEAAQALVDALPRCACCEEPATTDTHWCDVHARDARHCRPVELRHAAALRALLALLDGAR